MSDAQRPQADRDNREDKPAAGAPRFKPRDRGVRREDPEADSVMPARESGAGGETDNGQTGG